MHTTVITVRPRSFTVDLVLQFTGLGNNLCIAVTAPLVTNPCAEPCSGVSPAHGLTRAHRVMCEIRENLSHHTRITDSPQLIVC